MEKVRKEKSFTRSYRPLVIWLEDLGEIVSILKGTAKDVQISTEDYRFTTIEQVKEHYGSQTQFAMEITSFAPYVRLNFSRMWVRLDISSGLQSAQLFHDIDSILARRQRGFHYSGWIILPILIGGAVANFFPEQATPIVGVQLVLAVWYLWVSFIRLRQNAVINLQRRSEARPFLNATRISC